MLATPQSLLFLSLLVLSSALSHSFFSNYHTLFYLSHSLTSRVATLRAARGDFEGAARARALADNLERGQGLGFYKYAWNVGLDYVKNYAWRDTMSFQNLGGVASDLNELLEAFGQLNRMRSDAERVAWVGRNYKYALRVSQSLFARLLKVFRQSGPLRELVLTLQKEVLEGDLLRDCIELGADDLNGQNKVRVSWEDYATKKHQVDIYARSDPSKVYNLSTVPLRLGLEEPVVETQHPQILIYVKSFSKVDPSVYVLTPCCWLFNCLI